MIVNEMMRRDFCSLEENWESAYQLRVLGTLAVAR